ncbi:M81 family metallopeptidase [Kordiimonas sp.]|uniref:M81 family metallopeptidase n=1 Tax=Kordiimonas sp. TaxID=1970157 RepID=UPI003A8F6E53
MRVAIAGFQHETNSFVEGTTPFEAFVQPDAWPGMLQGAEMIAGTRRRNLPITGFIEAAEARGWQLAPLLWCSAAPSGLVERAAYGQISDDLIFRLDSAGPVDAVYLDLHGAMVAEGAPDADGMLLRRVRDLIGPDVLLVASLDFHANVSDEMVQATDALVVFRTYPHVDMADTGRRAACRLAQMACRSRRDTPTKKALVKVPFLIPMGTQSTLEGPMAEMMARIAELEAWGGAVEFAAGFPLADVVECGPAIIGYGDCGAASVVKLSELMAILEHKFTERLLTPDEAVSAIEDRIYGEGCGPVILADTQDNPGCGGTGDTVGLLRSLIDADICGAVVGVLHDPRAAEKAHKAGVGAVVDVALGARHGFGETPLAVRATVEALADGNFVGTGPFYQGCEFALGRMACLRVGDVRVVVSSVRQQAADKAMFRHVGIEPDGARVLALKSSVHYRADFGAIARACLTVVSPGANVADLSQLSYTALRGDVRIAGGRKITRIAS